MTKKVAILQSNYVPWKGYFDLIRAVDEFIVYDEVQYTKNDWRNRNRIKTQAGVQWLSIPVRQEQLEQKISETRIADRRWAAQHWRTISNTYARARYFGRYAPTIEAWYGEACACDLLSDINALFIRAVCAELGIATRITSSRDYDLQGDRVERLVSICRQAGAAVYLSGPAAREYLDEARFAEAGIRVEWMRYDGYPEYPQLFPPFEHSVSILDLLLNVGPEHAAFMKT
ncbi:WbqC family protein [Paraburkholderia kirstenboschensis]|uniref:WbqC family protein n=1 Tax=Paraburkholderia kirstenboschensis TaxID=1245436 RepID=A0ABZ0EPY2_9BURK|nr:WbqC family protein [Paraburkholderia kirstenboschensis]WOD18651.1 WbqC family protein [Paraburkholderia kirstenboschensis]